MPNRLAGETSPYLLQHKDNPIDWYPWGDEAFEKARREQKPILLSVGYSSCHWCHVMAHESFESSVVAELANTHFVSIKVDREERPDVDETYMAAVHLGSGRGGWPMTVFLTPDKKPFFAGTYFPKHDRGEQPGFISILRQIADAWATKRIEVEDVAEQYAQALTQLLARPAPDADRALTWPGVAAAVQALEAEVDLEQGGFGGRPKFPPHTSIEFLLAYARYGLDGDDEHSLRGAALAMALLALDRMALGGIRDHVGGGFHRYSTDERWLLPHFEKMLYDNALMLGNYARALETVGLQDPDFTRTARQALADAVAWMGREMISPEGLFYSALDADSEGREGRYYLWTEDEVREVLGADAQAFLKTYRFESGGNFTDEATGRKTGENIPHLMELPELPFEESLEALRRRRETRPRPATDTKALIGWNGLAIAGLAAAGETQMATRAARAVLEAERTAGGLPRQVVAGLPVGSGYLEDYAYFVFGLLELAGAVGGVPELRLEAERLADEMTARFWDDKDGGFYATSNSHEVLFGRSKPVFDQPIPSANAVAIRCLIRLGRMEQARKALEAFGGWIQSAPQNCEALTLAAMEFLLEAQDVDLPVGIPPAGKEVAVRLSEQVLTADPDGVAKGEVVISVPDGMHVNPYEPVAKWLVRTEVSIDGVPSRVLYPESTEMGYTGETRIGFEVTLPEGKDKAEFEVTVRYQACTDTECLAPAERRIAAAVTR